MGLLRTRSDGRNANKKGCKGGQGPSFLVRDVSESRRLEKASEGIPVPRAEYQVRDSRHALRPVYERTSASTNPSNCAGRVTRVRGPQGMGARRRVQGGFYVIRAYASAADTLGLVLVAIVAREGTRPHGKAHRQLQPAENALTEAEYQDGDDTIARPGAEAGRLYFLIRHPVRVPTLLPPPVRAELLFVLLLGPSLLLGGAAARLGQVTDVVHKHSAMFCSIPPQSARLPILVVHRSLTGFGSTTGAGVDGCGRHEWSSLGVESARSAGSLAEGRKRMLGRRAYHGLSWYALRQRTGARVVSEKKVERVRCL